MQRALALCLSCIAIAYGFAQSQEFDDARGSTFLPSKSSERTGCGPDYFQMKQGNCSSSDSCATRCIAADHTTKAWGYLADNEATLAFLGKEPCLSCTLRAYYPHYLLIKICNGSVSLGKTARFNSTNPHPVHKFVGYTLNAMVEFAHLLRYCILCPFAEPLQYTVCVNALLVATRM